MHQRCSVTASRCLRAAPSLKLQLRVVEPTLPPVSQHFTSPVWLLRLARTHTKPATHIPDETVDFTESCALGFSQLKPHKNNKETRLISVCPQDHDAAGATPLHLAARFGHRSVIQWLLCVGAAAGVETHCGAVSAHYTAASGDLACLELLVQQAPG